MRADWERHRDELMAFWKTGEHATVFPDSPPWLYAAGSADTLPSAARQFDR